MGVGGQGKLMSSPLERDYSWWLMEKEKEILLGKKWREIPSWEPEAFGHQLDMNMVFSEETRLQDPNWQGLN